MSNFEVTWRVRQNNKKNAVNFSVCSESLRHALKKLEICYYLKMLGLEFYTEAMLGKNGRADIFVVGKGVAIEVLDSEKDSNLEVKARNYGCRVVGVRVLDEVNLDIVEKLVN